MHVCVYAHMYLCIIRIWLNLRFKTFREISNYELFAIDFNPLFYSLNKYVLNFMYKNLKDFADISRIIPRCTKFTRVIDC